MKRNYLVIVLMLGLLASGRVQAFCDVPTPVPVELIRDTDMGSYKYPKLPLLIPSIALDDHTLYLYRGCDNTTIELVDENDMVVFSTLVAEGTETIELPASLTGTYEIRIIRGGITFVGEVVL